MFNWFSKKTDNTNTFHGVDLTQWHYVGYTRIQYQDEMGTRLASAFVYGFVNKNNFQTRQYKIVNGEHGYRFDQHDWVSLNAELWKIGERDLWRIAENEPSQWLVSYMKNTQNKEWDYTTLMWFDITDVPIVEYQSDSNVVHLQFKKSDEFVS